MIIIDLHHEIKQTGNFLSLAGLADFHFLCDDNDPEAFQPLNLDAYNYLQYCFTELKRKKFYGKIFTFTGGDTTELDRGGIRKAKKSYHKNDKITEDTLHKFNLKKYIIPKIERLVKGTQFIGGSGGNHVIEFCDQKEGSTSEEFIVRKLGGKYFGEGKALINFHFVLGNQRCLKKVIILHGRKAGTKQSIIRELKDIFEQYGKIDLVIKCHAHDPMTHFHCRYNLPDKETGKIKKVETLVMCLGSTRGGEVKNFVDYTEDGNYQPHAARYPIAVFHAYKPMSNDRTLDVKIRPYIM